MVAYQQFVALCQSPDSEERAQAAHMVAAAYITHDGPADEAGALYAAMIGFLEDASLKVRAALAYGLLRAGNAPRIIMLTLAGDAPVIARAVVQYCPVLLDVDLVATINSADSATIRAVAARQTLSPKLVKALIGLDQDDIVELLLERCDLTMSGKLLAMIADKYAGDEKIRAALLARQDLPAITRLHLMEIVKENLLTAETSKETIAPRQLERLLSDALDEAITRLGEQEEMARRSEYAEKLCSGQRVNTRILLKALINGRVMFFARCISLLAEMPLTKVFSLLERGGRTTLNAMFAKCAMAPALRNLVARLVIYARTCDLTKDPLARHLVVTALIKELIKEHDGQIPDELEEAFCYLDEQNIALARGAARGVMPGFALQPPKNDGLALQPDPEQLLPLHAA